VTLLALLLLAPVLIDLVRRPTFRNLAVRNISRRRGEAVLVIAGSLLGTAIITASFVVGDTVEAAIRDVARTALGPVDETVRLADRGELDRALAAISTPAIPGTDGVLGIETAGAVPASTAGDRRAEPAAVMVEVDFDQARDFGSDPRLGGLADAGPTPTDDQVVIGERLATTLAVGAGDAIELFAYGGSKMFTVRQVVADVGLVGYAPVRSNRPDGGGTRPTAVFVPPGTIDVMAAAATAPLAAGPASAGAEEPSAEVLVSNSGGVFDGADGSEAVAAELARRTASLTDAQVSKVKVDLLDQARRQGESFTDIFRSIGYFSVIAGVLLLVNLFVMLSEERKSEMGTLRALGFKRSHLVRSFGMEGAIYSVAASILGAVVGIGVGWAIIKVTSELVNRGEEELVFSLTVKPGSLVAGATLGLVICMVTVWATSVRIARLNIIRAIRDLPEPRAAKRSVRSLVAGGLLVAAGALAFQAGWSGDNAVAVLAGPPVACFGLIFVLGRYLPRKVVTTVCSLAALVWAVGVFTLAPEKVGQAGIDVFVVQGIVLVTAGVAILAQADRLWAALATRLSSNGGGLAARLGLAYPLARKFRTSLLLGMYSIVLFTMAFISVLSGIFANQAPMFADDTRAGYDVFVDSSTGNPVTAEELRSRPGVAGVAPLTRGLAQASTPRHPDRSNVVVTGFDESFLLRGQPKLDQRAAAYGDDGAAYRAVLADPGLIIVNQGFGSPVQGGGPPVANLAPGDRLSLLNPATGADRSVTVAGVMGGDFVFNSGLVSAGALDELLGPRKVVNRHYVAAAPGTDASALASSLNGAFIENGAQAESFRHVVEEQMKVQTGFFGLLRAYLGLGLLIGIAGLGVVMVRAVRERRREIGMLRAIGASAKVVRRAFVLEAAFITLQGILLGIGLGMLTSYSLIVNSDAFGNTEIDFSWPWTVLLVIAVGPLVASLAATAWPAGQAAAIRPAAALRIAD
jgi:putative ABC transport system permease protein